MADTALPRAFLQAGKRLVEAALAAAMISAMAACGGTPSLASSAQSLAYPPASDHFHPAAASSWTYTTLNNPDDKDYNELLGINNLGKICGYYGKGGRRRPSKGYCVQKYGAAKFRNENYPNAVDTYVTSLNSAKMIAGYYTTAHSGIFGFIYSGGLWTSYKHPGISSVTELLGINQSGLAVGFYQDPSGVRRGFELNQVTGKFHPVTPPGAVSSEATGINGKGDIVGWMQTTSGTTVGYLLKGGSYTIFSHPNSSITLPWGVNWQDQIVGEYQDSASGSEAVHGFVLSNPLGSPSWLVIDEPNADGYTVLTSIQDHEYMVGFYRDGSNHTNGFLATPKQ